LRRHSQVVRQGTANPRLPGSNPGGASSIGASNISLAPIFTLRRYKAAGFLKARRFFSFSQNCMHLS
jgi:hypothetical protein